MARPKKGQCARSTLIFYERRRLDDENTASPNPLFFLPYYSRIFLTYYLLFVVVPNCADSLISVDFVTAFLRQFTYFSIIHLMREFYYCTAVLVIFQRIRCKLDFFFSPHGLIIDSCSNGRTQKEVKVGLTLNCRARAPFLHIYRRWYLSCMHES